MDFSIRAANMEDCKDIARMIMLQVHNKPCCDYLSDMENILVNTSHFSRFHIFDCLLSGHTKIGYALYFYSYSWLGRGIYMEDLYVMPEFRGKGIGKALMSKLGLAAGCSNLKFTVLDWNKPSVDFYVSQGCSDITANFGFHCMRCEGEALEHLAQP
uniref:N-acetyltransferase domain-containing protein n=1 Tax=Monopterus albus TaxID=43700 RepID=A0A3Q3IGI7_MONAL